MSAVRIAAFDVDGTLTTRDCVVPFLRLVAGSRSLAVRLALQARPLAAGARRRDRDALKAVATQAAFTGRPVAAVTTLAESFAAEVHRRWLRADSVERLDEHRAAGDVVVLVSASYELYLRPLGALLGADHVLGTRLGVHPSGVLTGGLDGPNCRGPEKVRRLHALLEEHHGGRTGVELVAYGDSPGDRELLADADRPHWVGSAS